MNQYSLFVVLAPAGVAVGIALALFLWRHRSTRGAVALFWYAVTVTGYLLLNLLELVARDPEWTRQWATIAYVFIASFPVAWFSFALQHAQRDRWLQADRLLLILAIPVVTVAMALSNSVHRLVWQSWAVRWLGGFSALSVQYGRWFWVHAVYSFSLMLLGSAIIAGEFVRSHRLFRRRSRLMVVGVVVPILFNVVYVFRIIPGFTKDYSPLVYALSGVLFTVAIFRYGLLDVVPVARQTLFETMSDGILVLDRLGRVVDVNAAAAAILGCAADEMVGRRLIAGQTGPGSEGVPEGCAEAEPTIPAELSTGEPRFDYCQMSDGTPRTWDVKVVPLIDGRDQSVGRLITFHEVTELRRLVDQVEELSRVDSLTGLHTRDYVVERFGVELRRSRREGRALAILLVDVDRFRQVSADHGLVMAERTVSRVADTVRRECGPRAVIGRFGVAAFLVLLPEFDADGALATADRVRRAVEAGPTGAAGAPRDGATGVSGGGAKFAAGAPRDGATGPTDGTEFAGEAGSGAGNPNGGAGSVRAVAGNPGDGAVPAVTVSVGVLATDPTAVLSVAELLTRVDMALYTAKGAGRNALYLWREEEYPASMESGRSDSEEEHR